MLKAIIFDCDGVIADTEPIHMAAFGRVLAEEGLALTEDDYFGHYLALDDRGCFTRAFAERSGGITPDQLNELIERKAGYVALAMRSGLQLLPGVTEFIRRASDCYPLAVASGALRAEIDLVLNHGGLCDCFRAIVSSEDVARCKPHPDPFLKALEQINLLSAARIAPRECLVIEDSIYGVRAAYAAGMRCLAVTNSYPKAKLSEAELIVDSLAGLPLMNVETLFET